MRPIYIACGHPHVCSLHICLVGFDLSIFMLAPYLLPRPWHQLAGASPAILAPRVAPPFPLLLLLEVELLEPLVVKDLQFIQPNKSAVVLHLASHHLPAPACAPVTCLPLAHAHTHTCTHASSRWAHGGVLRAILYNEYCVRSCDVPIKRACKYVCRVDKYRGVDLVAFESIHRILDVIKLNRWHVRETATERGKRTGTRGSAHGGRQQRQATACTQRRMRKCASGVG